MYITIVLIHIFSVFTLLLTKAAKSGVTWEWEFIVFNFTPIYKCSFLSKQNNNYSQIFKLSMSAANYSYKLTHFTDYASKLVTFV